jgi:hypothetical protein
MRHFSVGWAGPAPLRDELRRPVVKISAEFGHPAWRGASSVSLWRADGSGLKMFTQMHDVAPKLEVGVLNFELVSCPSTGEQFVDLAGRFDGEITAWKLCIIESGVIAESGMVLAGNGEIAIVAGGFPLTLVLRGVEFESPTFEPEYPWEEYQRSEF